MTLRWAHQWWVEHGRDGGIKKSPHIGQYHSPPRFFIRLMNAWPFPFPVLVNHSNNTGRTILNEMIPRYFPVLWYYPDERTRERNQSIRGLAPESGFLSGIPTCVGPGQGYISGIPSYIVLQVTGYPSHHPIYGIHPIPTKPWVHTRYYYI